MKFCQFCGAQLQDEDVFCSKCGANLTPKTEQPVQQNIHQPVAQPHQQPVQQMYQQPVQQTYQQPVQQPYQRPPVMPVYQQPIIKPAKSKEEKRGGIAKGVAIGLSVLDIIGYIIMIFVGLYNGNAFNIPVQIFNMFFCLIVILGLVIGKNNKIIGIAYIAYYPLWTIIQIVQTGTLVSLIDIYGTLIFIAYIFIGLLFILKNEKFKKAYFVPCLIILLANVINVIIRLLEYIEWYYDFEDVMYNFIPYIITTGVTLVVSLAVTFCLCYVAKVNWNVAPKGENTPVNATNNYVRVAQNAPNMQHQQPNNMNAVNYQNPPVYQNQQNNANYQNTQNYQNQ